MMNKKFVLSKILVAFLFVAFIFVPASAHEETAGDVAGEIVEHSEELVLLCKEIHDQTENIADDDTLDQDIRDLAEGIHVCSHELESIADHILKNAQEVQSLVSGSGDSVAINEAIAEINEHCGEFNTMLDSKHEVIHDLVFNAPESHEEYADATHDATHQAGDVADHIIEHTGELQSMLPGASVAASTPASTTTYVNAAEVPGIVSEISEHSDELFTAAESILLDTKAIVKDETVNPEIQALAKTIHLVSHELEDIAVGLQENSADFQTLSADPLANKAAMEAIIVEMEAGCVDYQSKLSAQHENIHELVYVAPESREANADAVHDVTHEAENVVDHLMGHLSELSVALNVPAAAQAQSSTETKASPGFGVIVAIGGICAVACLARKH